MATGSVTRNANGIANRAIGKATGDGTALSVAMGFKPMFLKVINLTDNTTYEKTEDMPANTTLKNVAGTQTVDTATAITLTERGFILSAAANGAGDSIVWFAD